MDHSSKVPQEETLTRFGSALRGSHNYFIPVARQFLKVGSARLDRTAIDKYMAWMQEQGYAPGTIERNWRVIRRLFKVCEVAWPCQPSDNPIIPEKAVYAPALEDGLVRKMIRSAVSGKLEHTEAVFLALSTTYGVRRVELCGIRSEDVNLRNRTIFIKTAKHGRERYHVIPEEIVPVLNGYRWPIVTPYQASEAWWDIEQRCGLPRLEEVGWHAIRRMLDRILIDKGIPIPAVESYLRWKKSSKDMAKRYYATTVVGVGGRGVAIGAPDRSVDEQVFQVHPWLFEWKSFGR